MGSGERVLNTSTNVCIFWAEQNIGAAHQMGAAEICASDPDPNMAPIWNSRPRMMNPTVAIWLFPLVFHQLKCLVTLG